MLQLASRFVGVIGRLGAGNSTLLGTIRGLAEPATKDMVAFDTIKEGKSRPMEATSNAAYEPVIKLIKFVDDLKKEEVELIVLRSAQF